MKCYVVNLDSQTVRLQRMSRTLSEAGVQLVRVPAVDGSSLQADTLALHQSIRGTFYQLGPGEIGCFLSHRRCWELISQSDDNYGVVMEDDLLLGEDAISVLSRDEWIPADADIVKLETVLARTRVDIESAALVGRRTLNRLRAEHVGGGAYVVSRTCAARLLDISEDFVDPVDQFLFSPALPVFDTLTTYQMVPALCVQCSIISNADDEGDALSSFLDVERRGKRKHESVKLFRELWRPFHRIYILIYSCINGQRWKRIPFD